MFDLKSCVIVCEKTIQLNEKKEKPPEKRSPSNPFENPRKKPPSHLVVKNSDDPIKRLQAILPGLERLAHSWGTPKDRANRERDESLERKSQYL